MFHFFRHNHIKGCQRLVEQQDIRLSDDIDEHLHFVFHTVGVVLEQFIPVLRLNTHIIEILVNAFRIFDRLLVDVHKELQKLPACKKLRYSRGREYISNILCGYLTANAVFIYIEIAAVRLQIPVQTVKQRCFSSAVSAEQPINFPFIKCKINISENFLFLKAL